MNHLWEIIENGANRFSNRAALGLCGEVVPWTYQDLQRMGMAWSKHWTASGVGRGEVVLLWSEGRPEWVAAFFGALHAGMTVALVPQNAPAAGVASIARRCDARHVLCGDAVASNTPALSAAIRTPIHHINLSHAQSAEGTLPSSADVAVIALTSGSTMEPRLVELTHGNLISNLEDLLAVRGAAAGSVFLSQLPPAHLFELMAGLFGPLRCGASVHYETTRLPNRVMECFRTLGVTHALCVPALLDLLYAEVMDELAEGGWIDAARREQGLAETARRLREEADAATLGQLRAGLRERTGAAFKYLISGGAALHPSWVDIAAFMGLVLEVGYGLSEASPIVSLGLATECPVGSVGRPLPRVEVKTDATGEILVRGPNVMRGYRGDAAASAEVLRDGWLRTGDEGFLDDLGSLHITGRLKEAMVNSSGETIHPEEIEPLFASPLFREYCVAGRRGPEGNDVPTLFLVPTRPDLGDLELDAEFRSLRSRAPARLWVGAWQRVDEALPRTALGKIKRRLLQGGGFHGAARPRQ